MARKNYTKFFEKYWDCPHCQRERISALRHTQCPGCGGPAVAKEKQYPSRDEITDPLGLALAQGAPHWNCSSCGSVNLDKYASCWSCNNPRGEDDPTNTVTPMKTNADHAINLDDAEHLLGYSSRGKGSSRQVKTPASPSGYSWEAPPTYRSVHQESTALSLPTIRQILVVAGGVATVLLLGVLLWATFSTKEVNALATGFSWSRTVSIDRLTVVNGSGWDHPIDAYNIRSSRELRETIPIYEDQTVTEIVPATCEDDLGNGATAEYDCSYSVTSIEPVKVGETEVYDTWYEYQVDRWVYYRSVQSSGNDREPYWPTYTLYGGGYGFFIGAERISGQYEQYSVHFREIEDEQPVFYRHDVTIDDWYKYQIGNIYTLSVNKFGAVMNNPLLEKE